MTADTVQSIDLALTETRLRYLAAEEAGDFTRAEAAYVRLNELLDQRIHLPQQRCATD